AGKAAHCAGKAAHCAGTRSVMQKTRF
ncbi:hypothetical protein A2U01_0087387, partial [Trifolium medium]|nr:hypothetical protein [Trifolium medium]